MSCNYEKQSEDYKEAAGNVFDGISKCDLLIVIISDPKDYNRGLFTEIGLALGMNKRVYKFDKVVGNFCVI